jgi:predicted tellurium resistance membrane protein TerC
MLELLSQPETWASLATLTLMEVVLGIDNIIFIAILAEKLPPEQRDRARVVGLALACVMRLLLLLAIGWIVGLTAPLFSIAGHPFAGRDLALLAGGLFLIYKATVEIHHKLEGVEDVGHGEVKKAAATFGGVIVQILLLDIVFSLDSVLTAVGMASHISIMMTAVIISLAVMMLLGKAISDFVIRHPSVKMLALSFLLLIGVSLMAEAFHQEIPKGYIYSAMAFSVFVEMLNLFVKRKQGAAVHLKQNVVGVHVDPTPEPAQGKG